MGLRVVGGFDQHVGCSSVCERLEDSMSLSCRQISALVTNIQSDFLDNPRTLNPVGCPCDARSVAQKLRAGGAIAGSSGIRASSMPDIGTFHEIKTCSQPAYCARTDSSLTFAHASVLRRAIRTLWLVLDDIDRMWIPSRCDWHLNERHYGRLEGRDKSEVARDHGVSGSDWNTPSNSFTTPA